MIKTSDRSLKSRNFRWLVAIATADAAILGLFIAPGLIRDSTATQLGVLRALSTVLLPILVLLLVNILPSGTKATLIYWRVRHVLPGTQAFTRHGPSDPRVDMVRLKKNVGTLPSEPKEQNATWYRLYKMVETRAEVISAQQDFLLYRDAAATSLPLAALGPIAMHFAGAGNNAVWWAGAMFLAQYLAAGVSARHAGNRFVCTVLAIHSTTKIGSRTAAAVS
jgi:hypothetical protein